jgi:carboxypeptidase Taq
MNRNYQSFKQQARELTELRSILSTLTWDQETMIPTLGSSIRAGQLSTLAAICHKRLTSPEMKEALEQLSEEPALSLWQQTSVKEMQRQYDKAVKIPETLISELAKTTSLAYQAWVTARNDSNFSTFFPWLKKVVELKREEARCLQSSGSLYEALLDEYEPKVTEFELDNLFESIKPKLSTLLDRIQSSKHIFKNSLAGDFPIHQQKIFGEKILTSMGFKWDAGRLDSSPHPFCTGLSPLDVRITTRYDEQDFSSSLFGIIHEGGHALYEQGLDLEHYGLPACEAISLGIHESQSRLWENQIARSRPFWEYWLPHLQKNFPQQLQSISLENFMRSINKVKASFIRVEADEITYGLHIILRYEIEKMLIGGDLEVKDIENVWNQKTHEYLGITPSCPSEGVLQDTHWSQGLIGYFPTYLLGTVYASQIFHSAQESIPELSEHIRAGRLYPLREWLQKKIHQHGKTLSASELIQEISGETLTNQYFLNYLENKFSELYDLKL